MKKIGFLENRIVSKLLCAAMLLFLFSPAHAELEQESDDIPPPPVLNMDDFEEMEFTLDQMVSSTLTAEVNIPASAASSAPVVITSSALTGITSVNILLLAGEESGPNSLSRTVVETDLRPLFEKAGLQVNWLEKDPDLDPTNYPLLVLTADHGKEKGLLKPDLYLLDAQLRDIVTLARPTPLRTTAGLWQATEHGYGMRAVVAMRKSLVNLAMKFLKELSLANPGKFNPTRIEAIAVPQITEKDPLEP